MLFSYCCIWAWGDLGGFVLGFGVSVWLRVVWFFSSKNRVLSLHKTDVIPKILVLYSMCFSAWHLVFFFPYRETQELFGHYCVWIAHTSCFPEKHPQGPAGNGTQHSKLIGTAKLTGSPLGPVSWYQIICILLALKQKDSTSQLFG